MIFYQPYGIANHSFLSAQLYYYVTLTMPLTNDELVALHKKAAYYLEIKLKKVPARMFSGHRKPTLSDVYERPNSLFLPTVPKNLQVDYIFANYNQFAEAKFKARKRDQHRQISAAIFYWNMDHKHSLSTHHQEIRYNIILAHLVLEEPKARAQLEPTLITFLQWLIHAWLETAMHVDHVEDETRDMWIHQMWKPGKYDLIRWSRAQHAKMFAAVKALHAKVAKPPFSVEEYWTKAREQSVESFRRDGASWALQYIVHKENQAKDISAGDRALEAEDSLVDGSFISSFNGLSVDIGDWVPEYLSEELFKQPLVKALLVDVNAGITPERPWGLNVLPLEGTEKCWMAPAEAVALLEGRVSGLEDITKGLASMRFLS